MALYNCTYTLFFDKPICVSSRQSITQFDVYYSSHQSNKLLPTVIHSNEHQTYGTYKYKSSRVEKFINQSNSIYTRGAACKSRATIVAQQRATARRGKKHSVAYVHASASRRRKNAEVIKRDTNRSSTDIYIYICIHESLTTYKQRSLAVYYKFLRFATKKRVYDCVIIWGFFIG